METLVIAAKKSPDMLDYLGRRRSVKVKDLAAPGPTTEELNRILEIAARVPDHGKLVPWYFVVIQGEARAELGRIARDIYQDDFPDASPDDVAKEEGRFMRAPVVVAVVHRRREGKSPWWEQIMSAGAACYNMTLAAHASGYGAVWLSEWVAFDPRFKAAFGLDVTRDYIAGFIYIGTMAKAPTERDRPDLNDIVTHWHPGVKLKTGDVYNRDGFGLADDGF